jgi:transcriptional regulator with XRE-family HTH domain
MKRLKQSQVAEELGISKSYLSMILSGQRKAPPELVKKLSSQNFVNFEARFSLRGRCPKPLDECAV